MLNAAHLVVGLILGAGNQQLIAPLTSLTFQIVGDAKVLEQIEKQLHKLVDVLRVSELGQGAYVEREVMLVKIQA
ncbi:acetolactate synthase small subunit, partial [Enterobacter hormaechei]|uniref:acetolactate synthase small subunit n=1 Tax=Enterobacter hormaechei TaxID=158836 RepID=UPI003DA6D1B3